MKKIDIEELKAKISRKELYNLYITQNKQQNELCEILNISKNTLWQLLKEFNIIKLKKITFNNIDITKVIDLYITKNYTVNEIARIFNTSKYVIEILMKKHNIVKEKEQKKISIQKSYFRKTGYENPSQNPEVKKKKEETCMKNYKVKNPLQCNKIKEKCKKSYYEKTGYKNPAQNPEVQAKMKATNLERRGYENATQDPEVQKKIKQTNLEKRGVENPFADKSVKEKIKQTHLSRRGVNNPAQDPEIHKKMENSCYINNGVYYPMQSEEIRKKGQLTKAINNTWSYSSKENQIAYLLLIKYPNVKRQYKSEEYPFLCDFYIPLLNLYIEYQGDWSHGKDGKKILRAYNNENPEHEKILEKWKEKTDQGHLRYKGAIDVWTIRDPLKRETARKNNLNWLEFFTIDEFLSWYRDQTGVLLLTYNPS